ncbi:hypothetical protein DL89DRAFT_290867 [Linderina pennispora]|uniref:Uncharacterized protein n=1 Tax=Linderina pennispora TaxID=61395 RepID=A0A1Y1WHV9_9FUNG|nr:uncharacterized protein DL89DRAFT_290867 [Linderina pennispora]ORX73109.1 hypothetical protein DL89DRAFT_290867 [Linderina pennispora]
MVSVTQIASAAVLAVAVQAQRPGGGKTATPEFSELMDSVSENWSSYYNFITSGLPVLQRIRTSEYGWLTAAFGGTSIPTTFDEAFVSKAILGGAFGAYKTPAEGTEVSSPTAATEGLLPFGYWGAKSTGAPEASELSDDDVESEKPGASSGAAKSGAVKSSATTKDSATTKGSPNGAAKVAGSFAAAAAVAAAAFF